MRKYVLIALLLLPSGSLRAQEHWESLEPYLTDDVVAVAYVDLSQIDTIDILDWVQEVGFGLTDGQRKQAMKFLPLVQQKLDQTTNFGARYVYALFRTSDLPHGGPSWVIPVPQDGNELAVLGLLLSGRPNKIEIEHDARPAFFPDHCVVHNSAVLGANTPEQLQQLKTDRPKPNRDWSDAWSALGGGHCGVIVVGDQDSRRVVRELMTRLPAPLDEIDGTFVADRLQWAGFVADLPSKPSLKLVFQADGQSAAETLSGAVGDGLSWLRAMPIPELGVDSAIQNAIVSAIEAEVVDSQLVLSFGDVDHLSQLLAQPIAKARQDSQRRAKMNKYKQIALGMLNYESANGSYPPRASFSDEGKPLLSWRVHILPYLGLTHLYDQFRLDEPWDSKHNKQLIPLMPEIYADPDPAMAKRNGQGRTTFVVPTGTGTLYEKSDGPQIKDVTDGTSQTIMLVEIKPNSAPVWTRPKDWSPSKIPYEMFRRDDRDWFMTGYCDGHVQIHTVNEPIEQFKARVSPAGGEVLD